MLLSSPLSRPLPHHRPSRLSRPARLPACRAWDRRYGPGGSEQRWQTWLAPLEQEVRTPLPAPVTGRMPKGLLGTAYFNGPGAFGAPGKPITNLFDGDGMLVKVDFTETGVFASAAFLDTETRRRDLATDKPLFGGLSQRPPSGARARLDDTADRQPANTHAVVHGGHGWALHESSHPLQFDPASLDTLGPSDLDGLLQPRQKLSAHPKVCPKTGDLWNIGLHHRPLLQRTPPFLSLTPSLQVYRSHASGQTHEAILPTPLQMPFAASMVHDFALTDDKLVVAVAPLIIDRPWAILTCSVTPEQALRWAPELGTHIAVIDRHNGAAQWWKTDAFLPFHSVQAAPVADGSIALDICAFVDAGVAGLPSEVMRGVFDRVHQVQVRRLSLRPDGTVKQTLMGLRGLDFPRIAPAGEHGLRRYIHGAGWSGASPFADLPMMLDTQTGRMMARPWVAGEEFAGELLPVPKGRYRSERDVWLLTLAQNHRKAHAPSYELRVYDGTRPQDDAVCVAQMPFAFPLRFHGSFVPKGQSASLL